MLVRRTLFGAIALLVLGVGAAIGMTVAHRSDPASTTNSIATTMPPQTTTTLDLAGLRATFDDAVAPANQAIGAFNAAKNALPRSATIKEFAPLTDSLVNGLMETQRRCLATKWPAIVSGDVDEYVRAVGAMIGDLQSIRSQTAFSISSWDQKLHSDAQLVTTAGSLVRRDLRD